MKPILFHSEIMTPFLNKQLKFKPLQPPQLPSDSPPSMGSRDYLSSLSFPLSFPYDFMHLIWSNLIVNLIHLWTAKFKDLDHDDQDYVLMPTVWQAIGEATFNSGKTIPAAFSSRVPNIASEKAHMIAETYSIWTLHIAPILLKSRFQHQR